MLNQCESLHLGSSLREAVLLSLEMSQEESCHSLPVFPHLRGLSPVSHLCCGNTLVWLWVVLA